VPFVSPPAVPNAQSARLSPWGSPAQNFAKEKGLDVADTSL